MTMTTIRSRTHASAWLRVWLCTAFGVGSALGTSQSAAAPVPNPATDVSSTPGASAGEGPAPEQEATVPERPAAPLSSMQAAPPAQPPAPAVPAPAPAARPVMNLHPERNPCPPGDAEHEREAAEGAGMFFLGAGFFDISALNERLAANDYERLPTSMTILGGEGHAVFDSGFVAGARGGGLLSRGGDGPDGMHSEFGGGFGMLDFGFAFVQAEHVLVTLTGAIGGYGLSLAISEQESATFDEALSNPRRGVSLDRGGVLMGLTLGIDGRVPVGEVERGRRGFFTLGARAGALYGPALGGWGLSEGAEATSGPALGLTGVYAALAIGFGGGKPIAQHL